MINIQLYNEQIININGIETRIGEDAVPFANKAGMFVADGMGGSAGVRIVSFNPACFDKEELKKLVCAGKDFSTPEQKEQFEDYVVRSFASLTTPVMKTMYENITPDIIIRLKKSGYVGSHALGLVMAENLIGLEKYLDEKEITFDQWKLLINELKDKLVQEYKKVIKTLGAECAKVSLNGIDYYGTTLSAVFFWENEDSVDVIFLNCGDSRSYVLDADGLRQAAEDQGRDGGMTSRFRVEDGVEIDISLEERHYSKPCSIISVSDGFYTVFQGRGDFHSSPLQMEGYFLNMLSASSSVEEFEARLKRHYERVGRIDDSNSMVMAAFGYSDFAELRESAKARFAQIMEKYKLAEMPDDFLVVDYQKELLAIQKNAAKSIESLLESAYEDGSVHDYCLEQIELPEYVSVYHKEVDRIERDRKELVKSQESQKRKLIELARGSFADFLADEDYDALERKLWGGDLKREAQKNKDEAKEYVILLQKRAKVLQDLVMSYRAESESVDAAVDLLKLSGNLCWDEGISDDSQKWAAKQAGRIQGFRTEVDTMLKEFGKRNSEIEATLANWYAANDRFAKKFLDRNGKAVYVIVNEWIEKADSIEELLPTTTIPFVREEIIRMVRIYTNSKKEDFGLVEQKEDALERAAAQFWKDNAASVIYNLIQDAEFLKDNQELKKSITAALNENGELTRYQRLAQAQKEIFDEYLQIHLSEVSEDKKNDVERNGWL